MRQEERQALLHVSAPTVLRAQRFPNETLSPFNLPYSCSIG